MNVSLRSQSGMISPPHKEAEKSSFWLEKTDVQTDIGRDQPSLPVTLDFTLTSGGLRKTKA